MSRAAMLSRDTDSTQVSKTSVGSSGLRVNRPGDAYEVEADRVADAVSSGGRISGWSLASSGLGQIQRQSAPPGGSPSPQPVAQSTSPGDILAKLAEAFIATKAGKALLAMIQRDPLVKDATDFVTTPAGIVVAGSAAIGTVSALAAAHQPLPLQIPKIPLDILYPGLEVKIDYQGPVNHPTAAMLTVSFAGKAPKKKQQSSTDANRAETARMTADQEKFRAGMQPGSRPGPGPVRTPEYNLVDDWNMRRLAAIGKPGQIPLRPADEVAPHAMSLHMPEFGSSLKPKTPTLLDKQLELKAPTPEAKKEELPIQRKAATTAEVFADSTDVDSVINHPGRPLDRETRRFMESRFGYDFSNVRLHTDSRAATSARALHAHAYTVGKDVVFAAGHYAPQTTTGRRLLAHELTHVVQQADGSSIKSQPQMGRPHDALEREADNNTRMLGSAKRNELGKKVTRHRIPAPVLQRYEAGEHAKFGETGEILNQMVSATALTYKVKSGDTLNRLAAKFHISEAELIAANSAKLKHWRFTDPARIVDGFTIGDDITIPPTTNEAIKEALKTKEIVLSVNGVALDYGEGIAMGDFFETNEQMLSASPAELQKLSALIKQEKSGTPVTTDQWQAATGGRYLKLAEKNEKHFAPSNAAFAPVSGKSTGNHKTEWENNHRTALEKSQGGDKDKALAINTFADHFLTDAFAAGHLFNKRDVMEKFQGNLPKTATGDKFTPASQGFFNEIAKRSFTGAVKTEFSKWETVACFSIWGDNPEAPCSDATTVRATIDSESTFSKLVQGIHMKEPDLLESAVAKGAHDTLNTLPGGLPVENNKGDKWQLSGDNTLNDETLKVGRKAVAQSQMNVLDVFKLIGALDLVGLFKKVWDFVPRPQAGAAETTVKDTVSSGTDPKSPSLINAVVNLINANFKAIIKALVEKGILQKH